MHVRIATQARSRACVSVADCAFMPASLGVLCSCGDKCQSGTSPPEQVIMTNEVSTQCMMN